MNLPIPVEYLSGALAFPSYTGTSPESEKMLGMLKEALDRLFETSGKYQRAADTIAALDDVYQECCESNWDGYGAQPITEEVYQEAFKLLTLLPSNFPMPEVVPEPTGGIGLQWSGGKRLVFVASVRGENFITYAGIFGVNKTHGREYFSDSLPPIITANIRRLYSYKPQTP